MKKRLLSILLTWGLIVSMTACSNDAPKNSQSNNDTASTAEVPAFDNYARPQIVSNEDVSIIYLISNLTDESNKRCEQQVAIEAAHGGCR